MKTILCTFALAMLTVVGTQAQVVEPVDKHKIANGGYDVVAYFTDQAPAKGKAEYTHEVNGIKYQFASAEHRALFAQSPERYLPVCDGYCAWGVAEKGKKVPVDPRTFKVINGKLHLFFNGDFNGSPFNTLPEWNKNEQQLLKQLATNWEKLSK